MRPSAELYELFQKRLNAFAQDCEHIHGHDLEALHRARVASRRLRELLPLVNVKGASTEELGLRLRRFTKRLGRVRELDVLWLALQELERNNQCPPEALRIVGITIVQTRTAARKVLAAKLSPDKLKGLVKRLERAAKHLEWTGHDRHRDAGQPVRTWKWALDARLTHRAANLRAAITDAGAVYSPARLHAVRIALKKFRYALELRAEGGDAHATADLAILKTAQGVLGSLHDLEVLIDAGRQAQVTLSPPDLKTWRDLEALVHAIEDACRALHARYMRDRSTLLMIARRVRIARRPVAPGVQRATA